MMLQKLLMTSWILLLLFFSPPTFIAAVDAAPVITSGAVASVPVSTGSGSAVASVPVSTGSGSAAIASVPAADLNAALASIPSGDAAGFLSSFTNTLPALSNFPAFSSLGRGVAGATGDPKLDAAIAQFSEPIVRFVVGDRPVPSDIRQMVGTLPDLIINIPGIGNVDMTKVCCFT